MRKIFFIIRITKVFDERFKVTPVPFFTADFNLLSCKLDNFTFSVLYWVIFILILHLNKINDNTLTVAFEKSRTGSFASSVMKNIVEHSAVSRFPVKLICCIALGSSSSFGCFLKSIPVNL